MTIILSILFPLLCGASMLLIKKLNNRNARMGITVGMEIIQTIFAIMVVSSKESSTGSFEFAKGFSLSFNSDLTAKLFCIIVSIAWLLVTIYATIYMKHEKNEERKAAAIAR